MKRALVLAPLALAALIVALAMWSATQATRYPVGTLSRRTPPVTALMRQRVREAEEHGRRLRIQQRSVPLERVSPLLWRAILVAEDDKFFEHAGLDWTEIRASAERDWQRHRLARGGSTVTQQLARNLYLGDQKTVTRKLTEAFLAIRMERVLSKRRILELYLNLIEWGDGVFGIEAASRHYFGVSASQLDPRQAVLLASVVINPRRYSVLAPPRRIQRRATMIAKRLRRRGYLDDRQYRIAVGQPPPPLFPWFHFPWSSAAPTTPADTTRTPVAVDTSAPKVEAPADTAAAVP